jgi:hypothetical protein
MEKKHDRQLRPTASRFHISPGPRLGTQFGTQLKPSPRQLHAGHFIALIAGMVGIYSVIFTGVVVLGAIPERTGHVVHRVVHIAPAPVDK